MPFQRMCVYYKEHTLDDTNPMLMPTIQDPTKRPTTITVQVLLPTTIKKTDFE